MAKVNPHIDLQTGYVQLSRLPFDQAIQLRKWLPTTSLVSLNTELGKIDDAIQYSEYEYWFDFFFTSAEAQRESEFEL